MYYFSVRIELKFRLSITQRSAQHLKNLNCIDILSLFSDERRIRCWFRTSSILHLEFPLDLINVALGDIVSSET